MWQLYQFPLCPFSRKLRLLMGEKNIAYELVREHPWEGRDEFWHLNPAGRTPVLHDAGRGVSLSDSQAICEFLEETVERNPMINGSALQRAEIRRLVALFHLRHPRCLLRCHYPKQTRNWPRTPPSLKPPRSAQRSLA